VDRFDAQVRDGRVDELGLLARGSERRCGRGKGREREREEELLLRCLTVGLGLRKGDQESVTAAGGSNEGGLTMLCREGTTNG
jgi:hypothetical protein